MNRILILLTAQIVDIVIQSLQLSTTPLPTKLARLYLCSDILHNSAATIGSKSVTGAWQYRQTFQNRLNPVFDHLHTLFVAYDSRMKADGFRRSIKVVLDAWESWSVFSTTTLDEFERRLVHGNSQEVARDDTVGVDPSTITPVSSVAPTFMPMVEEEDIDGVAMDDDVDGVALPLDDDDEDIDGEVLLDDEEDIDGEALADEDEDGEVMAE